MKLDLTFEVGEEHEALLREHVPRAAELLKHAPDALSVAVVGDAEMAQLHEQFLNLPGPTDVLTFELDHDQTGRVTEGEIVVCLPEAQRQAATRSHDAGVELLLYVIHGLLHLVGYDDHDPADYAAMHAKEDQILQSLGFGTIFGEN